MTGEEIKQQLQATPFQPFDVHLASGKIVRVPHPDYAFISPSGRMLIVATDTDAFKILDMHLVESLDVSPPADSASPATQE